MNFSPTDFDWNESPIAANASLADNESMFRQLFERSADAIFLFDPGREVFVDCNQAAVEMMRASSKKQLLMVHPEHLSSEFQPDGKSSREKTTEVISVALAKGSYRFEWRARRMDGTEFPLEVLLTAIQTGEHPLMATVCRDISDRKRTEREILELNASLEQHVAQRTSALQTSEARFRALVEHAPEAIVVFDGISGRFLFGNEHACKLYGVPMEKLAALTPADVSPEFQADGRPSSESAREKMDEALAGGMAVFEWVHKQQPSGKLIPTEVRLLRLPAEGQNLLRASIIDNTERKAAERALRESEAKFRALFEGASQGVVLHDEHQMLEANPAAVRILGRHCADELIGKHPGAFSPPFQTNGESSLEMARKYIDECMTKGSARFDWLACDLNGNEISLEVCLTRIEWSGRQVIQAFITDITERKRAQAALAESEARFNLAFQASPTFIGILRMSDGAYVLANDAFVNWVGYSREEIIGHTSADFGMWDNVEERNWALNEMRTVGSIRDRECRWRNRRGETRTILLSAETIKLHDTPHILSFALDITERKRVEEELRASEARLRESEARFSVAFHSSPIITGICRASDATFVLVNDESLTWSGYSRDEVIGRTSVELAVWESPAERQRLWDDVRNSGSIRAREVRVRNRTGKVSTMLASGAMIEIDGEKHLLVMMVEISERKKAEAELQASEARLRESEARFSAAFNSSPIMTGITRASDGKFVLVNDAAVNWTGYSRDEILGRTSVELGLWEDPAQRAGFWDHIRTSEPSEPWECQLKNRHGRRSTMLASGVKIRISGEDHLLVMMVDITERKKVEAELHASEARLRESEARFSAAFQASPVSIIIYGMDDRRCVLANEAFLSWSGYRLDEVLGRDSLDLGIWTDPAERESYWQELLRTHSVHERECRMRNRHGQSFIMLISADVITINGAPHVLAVGLDITQRKKAEAEIQASEARLRESEGRFSAAFQASPALIGILRVSDGTYVLTNDAHLNWLGYPREEVIGRTCLDLGMWENPAERDVVLKDMQTFGSIRQRECRWRNRRGERFTILLSAETIQLNNTPHLLTIALDITQRKRAEEEVLKSLEREKELGQLKSNFVSMVSHEFRTPLGIIQSSAELLRDFHPRMQAGERNEQLASISRNTQRMAGMMEEILVLSQLDAGKLMFQPAPLDLNIYCHRLVDEVLSATNRRCQIELSLSSIPCTAEADERLLGHIFTNLLSNAVKYSEPSATVHWTVERRGSDAVCVIRDCGIGISEKDQERLFTAFHRGSNVGTRAGTGLGLVLVKRCAELHGGKVQINSKIGEGTTAIVKLPVFAAQPLTRAQRTLEAEQV